jgi:hypothetical protein
MLYANRIRRSRGAFSVVNRPPGEGRIIAKPFPLVFGLIDATSNSGRAGDCASASVAGISTIIARDIISSPKVFPRCR